MNVFTLTKSRKHKFFEYLCITIGITITTVGLYVFYIPNGLIMGGVTGISVALSAVLPAGFPLTTAWMITILNLILLAVGFIVLGKDFGLKTVYTTLLMSGLGIVIEKLIDGRTLTNNIFLETCYAVLLPGIGTAIVFYFDASGGGTDVIAMIINKKSKIESGKALLCVDFLITLVAFTNGLEIGLLSLFGLLAKALIIDKLTGSMNWSNYCIIVTTHPDEVGVYINLVLHRGATVWKGMGAYTHEDKYIMLVVMNKRQAKVVRDAIKKIDEHAFIVVDGTSDVVGNGFKALF